MNNDDLVKAWFAKASSDLRNAEIVLAIASEIKEFVLQKVNPGGEKTGGGK